MQTHTDDFQDIRDAVRALCAGYPDEYFRKIDLERGYPAAFVKGNMAAGLHASGLVLRLKDSDREKLLEQQRR